MDDALTDEQRATLVPTPLVRRLRARSMPPHRPAPPKL